MWRRRSWFSLKGKAGIPGQTEGCPATSIGPRVLAVGSLQQRALRGSLLLQPVWPLNNLTSTYGPVEDRRRVSHEREATLVGGPSLGRKRPVKGSNQYDIPLLSSASPIWGRPSFMRGFFVPGGPAPRASGPAPLPRSAPPRAERR